MMFQPCRKDELTAVKGANSDRSTRVRADGIHTDTAY